MKIGCAKNLVYSIESDRKKSKLSFISKLLQSVNPIDVIVMRCCVIVCCKQTNNFTYSISFRCVFRSTGAKPMKIEEQNLRPCDDFACKMLTMVIKKRITYIALKTSCFFFSPFHLVPYLEIIPSRIIVVPIKFCWYELHLYYLVVVAGLRRE